MTRVLFVGDLHSDLECAERMAKQAKELQCSEIIQVGDWGFKWPGDDRTQELTDILDKYGVPMRFCDGNHDHHPELRKVERGVDFNVSPLLTYQHRGTMKTFIGGTRMVFLGGAPSIDRELRVQDADWWEEEYITEEDVQAALEHKGWPIDVLVTHDAAIKPEGFKEWGSASFEYRAAFSNEAIQTVIRELKPRLHIHGHYHHRYESQFEDTKVIGLGANVGKYHLLDIQYLYER